MSSLERIYIVHTEDPKNEDSTTDWYWDRDEAEAEYDRLTAFEDYEVTLYSANVQQTIQDFVDGAIGSGATGLNELRSNRPAEAEEQGSWTSLEYRPEGYFYIERINSPDYWPFKVESYGETGSWRVVDATMGTPMAIIHPYISEGNAVFKVTVNGFSRTTPFVNLEGAVKFAITEFNG